MQHEQTPVKEEKKKNDNKKIEINFTKSP